MNSITNMNRWYYTIYFFVFFMFFMVIKTKTMMYETIKSMNSACGGTEKGNEEERQFELFSSNIVIFHCLFLNLHFLYSTRKMRELKKVLPETSDAFIVIV